MCARDHVISRHSATSAAAAGGGGAGGGAPPPPLFAYLAFHMIHEADGVADPPTSVTTPPTSAKLLECPAAYSNPFRSNASSLCRRVFLGMVSLVDEAIGNATRAWEQGGYLGGENGGIVVVTSDNGSPPDNRGTAGNLPFRGFKHQLWEGGLRVPTFVYGTGVPAGGLERRYATPNTHPSA